MLFSHDAHGNKFPEKQLEDIPIKYDGVYGTPTTIDISAFGVTWDVKLYSPL